MKTQTMLDSLAWPVSRLGEGLEELAQRAGLRPVATEPLTVPELLLQNGSGELDRWVQWAAERLDLEAEPLATPASELAQLVRDAGPAVYLSQDQVGAKIFLVLKSHGKISYLIGPDSNLHRCPSDDLHDALCEHDEAPFAAEIDALLATAQVPVARRKAVRTAMVRERLASRSMGQCWLLRASPTAGFWTQVKAAKLPRKLVLMLCAFAVAYGLEIAGWSLMGLTTLNGQLDQAWLVAWALLMLSLIPVRLMGGWLDASFAVEFGRLLKARLLAGSLRMDVEVTRRMGAGQLLSRVMDSQALESLAFNGGMGVLVATLELAFAASILAVGAGGRLHLALLAAWLLLTMGIRWKFMQRLRVWTLMRLEMTHNLVERMVGHRTVLAQEQPLRRSQQQDVSLKEYLAASKAMDRSILPAVGGLPRGWMIVGLLGLSPGLIAGSANLIDLAIGFGGVMLANRALSGISGGLSALSSATLAWKNVAALFHAADNKSPSPIYLSVAELAAKPAQGKPVKLVDANHLVFRYQTQGEPVLRGADLAIFAGERVLLQGASGGGKSTMASLLVGLRQPESGLLLLNGLDRHTLGDNWHQLATEAPQFHENHILSGSLAFNLLMGRNWPASDNDLADAKQLCVELGLGDLIARMPSGMMQRVGETGWQLSHGERSRIFLARALLQNAQLTVLDESFAALDPQTLEKCLACALARARTLVVIAHP